MRKGKVLLGSLVLIFCGMLSQAQENKGWRGDGGHYIVWWYLSQENLLATRVHGVWETKKAGGSLFTLHPVAVPIQGRELARMMKSYFDDRQASGKYRLSLEMSYYRLTSCAKGFDEWSIVWTGYEARLIEWIKKWYLVEKHQPAARGRGRNWAPRTAVKLTPRKLLEAAAEICQGNLFNTLMTCHNSLKVIFRYNFIPYKPESIIRMRCWQFAPVLEQKIIANIRGDRGGDLGGSWYHFFGTAAFSFRLRVKHPTIAPIIVWMALTQEDHFVGGVQAMEIFKISCDATTLEETYDPQQLSVDYEGKELGFALADYYR